MDRNTGIAREIIILRGAKGWTQAEFAERLKTTPRTVAAWESGDSIPRKAMRVRIAQAFGLPEDYFLGKEESPSAGGGQETDSIRSILRQFRTILSESDAPVTESQKRNCMQACSRILGGGLEAGEGYLEEK